jgi:hypothetical protein
MCATFARRPPSHAPRSPAAPSWPAPNSTHTAPVPRRLPPRWVGLLFLAAFSVLFLVRVGGGRLAAPFGDSGDGYNGATWSSGSRALRDDPVASRLGARSPEQPYGFATYAHHPPLIYVVTAGAQVINPSHPELDARLLAASSTMVSAFLMFGVLAQLGVRTSVAVCGVVLGYCVPMLFTFGTMLDTTTLAMAPAAGFLLVWVRALRGAGSARAAGVLAAVLCLGSWEGVILVAVTGVLTTFGSRTETSRSTAVAIAWGAVVGLALTWGWLLWANGSLDVVLEFGKLRVAGDQSGVETATLGESIVRQSRHLVALFGIAVVLGPPAFVAAIRMARYRLVETALLVTVGLYSLVFFSGAAYHAHWNYWLLLPLAVGFAAIGEAIASRPGGLLISGAVVGTISIIFSLAYHSNEEVALHRGIGVGRQLASAAWPSDQRLAYASARYSDFPPLAYYAGRPAAPVPETADPRHLVLFESRCGVVLDTVAEYRERSTRACPPR